MGTMRSASEADTRQRPTETAGILTPLFSVAVQDSGGPLRSSGAALAPVFAFLRGDVSAMSATGDARAAGGRKGVVRSACTTKTEHDALKKRRASVRVRLAGEASTMVHRRLQV